MTRIEPRIPKGMRDLEPSEMMVRYRVLEIIRTTFERYGYEPIETPALEYWDVLTGKYGQEAERLVYHLTDHGGRELGLRYDLTVPLARYVASRKQLPKPFKRYQIQPVWRAEKPQKGRYREFYQCDVDAVGSASMLVDAELIALIVDVMRKLGFQHFHVLLNNRKILQAMVMLAGIDADRTADVCQTLDKFDKIGQEKVDAELAGKGYADSQIAILRDILSCEGDNDSILSSLKESLEKVPVGIEGIAELEEIMICLRAMKVPDEHCVVSPRLTRGLDYYTGPVYETVLTDIAYSSLGGGGRYNGLVGIFSTEEIPAAGTSFGLDRIVTVLMEREPESAVMTSTQVLVTQFSPELAGVSCEFAAELREAGIRTEIAFDSSKLKKQLTYANSRGIHFVAVIGPDEAASGQVQMKDMRSGQQVTLERSEAAAWIVSALAV